MGMVYYTSVAPNKEAAICGGLAESAIKFIQNTDYHKNIQIGSYNRESFINSMKTAFEKALNKFDEDGDYNDPCIVETFYYIHCNCKCELIYISSSMMFKHYYIRFELFQ